ncbi:hypothetical protein [Flavobacterium terrae]|uniref:PH domain-containing protein n=1 Tax=Flavobacterium terrae TaxID=415425 RepID=A0A1M6GKU6_9FLAO|nr:hypothetical protein [Flavobacterium terrae]SHJ10581.1 hypothetical protein SAMN05444363_2668 [Flavobacterium terrae]
MRKLKINLKSQLRNWNDFTIQTLILIPFAIYAYHEYKSDKVLYPFYIFSFIQFSFTAYLHLRYYFQNKGEEYIIDSKSITKFKKHTKEVYLNDDIKKIEICKSANMDSLGIPYTTFERFRCARIYLKNGQSFILTNLLEFDLESSLKILKDVEFIRRKGFSFFI